MFIQVKQIGKWIVETQDLATERLVSGTRFHSTIPLKSLKIVNIIKGKQKRPADANL